MRKTVVITLIVAIVASVSGISCIKYLNGNKKILFYYRYFDTDSLKYEAAKFLIDNMQ